MKYTIISIDDSRHDNKEYIRACMAMEEAMIDCVNGKDPSKLFAAKTKWHDVETPGPFKAGEFGIFYSVLNALEFGAEDDGILYFEDDAVPVPDIQERLNQYYSELPEFDMFALWSPANQKHDFENVSSYNDGGEPIYNGSQKGKIFDIAHPELCRLWNGYGNVSMMFSQKGCQKLINYIKQRGFFSPVDCLICIASHTGILESYALKPSVKPIINYDWNRPTTIHHSKWGMIEQLMEE